MAVFKNYSFEYNAKSADIFKSTVVCISSSEANNYREGESLDIPDAGFYGVVTESKNAGSRLTLDIVAESYSRELRNNLIYEETTFRQVDAINLIKSHLLPPGWEFEYPSYFDTNPRYISYILRNGTYISHISTVLSTLGLDFTIFTSKSGGVYTKTIKAYFRDNFDGRTPLELEEWKQFGNLSLSVDYGKIATSIVVMGSESELGITQVTMDAEIGNWDASPRAIEIKDTQLKRPEFSETSKYFWYFPASETDYTIDLFVAGEFVNINDERVKIKSMHFLPESALGDIESGVISEDEINSYLLPLSSYNKYGVIVASVETTQNVYLPSIQQNKDIVERRNVNAYLTDPGNLSIYDPILVTSAKISDSIYFTNGKNLPDTAGFIWIGSERIFYRSLVDYSSYFSLTNMVRGIPTCATKECEHCGTRLGHVGYTTGCIFGGSDTNEGVSSYCILAQEIIAAGITISHSDTITNNGTACPVCFETVSQCPLLACKNITNDTQFSQLCPKGLKPSEIQWTYKYIHNKNAIVFPDTYYYNDPGIGDVYELYARDSLISRYGYIPTQVQVKGIADTDGLDKVAEGYLRLSALPLTGKFTYFHFAPWVTPAGLFPGDVISVRVASYGRYDPEGNGNVYPAHWFDHAYQVDIPGDADEWISINAVDPDWGMPNHWYRIQQTFVIQKTVKTQRGPPEIYFGTGQSDFSATLEYLKDMKDTTSQRHRNQELSKTVQVSENGYAAQVQNVKTGEKTWVRMVR